MNKILGAIFTVVMLATCVLADSYTIPKDNNGIFPGDANLVGVSAKYSVTYTTQVITDQPALVYGVTINSLLAADATGYVVVYDTANAVSATMTDAGMASARVTTNLVQALAVANRTVITFSPPIICKSGIVVMCPGTTGATSPMQFSIQYRNRNKGN